jgi:hypothetical protein
MSVIAYPDPSTCLSCGIVDVLVLETKVGELCLECSGLGYLEFLPSGDAALTRRITKMSRRFAVVARRSRRRYGYERMGILAEPAVIERAAREYLLDNGGEVSIGTFRQRNRAAHHAQFRAEFAAAIRERFPGCPADRADAIALHITARNLGRSGRVENDRLLESDAVLEAVVTSVRNIDTDYDEILMSGVDRDSASGRVRDRVDAVIAAWRDGVTMLDG